MKEFAESLIAMQKSLGLNQAEMAKKLGIAPGTYSSYINDKKNPQITDVAEFAKILGTSISWLCGEDQPRRVLMRGQVPYRYLVNVLDEVLAIKNAETNESLFSVESTKENDTKQVIFKTNDSALADYYKSVTTMQALNREHLLDDDTLRSTVYALRRALPDQHVNGLPLFRDKEE